MLLFNIKNKKNPLCYFSTSKTRKVHYVTFQHKKPKKSTMLLFNIKNQKYPLCYFSTFEIRRTAMLLFNIKNRNKPPCYSSTSETRSIRHVTFPTTETSRIHHVPFQNQKPSPAMSFFKIRNHVTLKKKKKKGSTSYMAFLCILTKYYPQTNLMPNVSRL